MLGKGIAQVDINSRQEYTALGEELSKITAHELEGPPLAATCPVGKKI